MSILDELSYYFGGFDIFDFDSDFICFDLVVIILFVHFVVSFLKRQPPYIKVFNLFSRQKVNDDDRIRCKSKDMFMPVYFDSTYIKDDYKISYDSVFKDKE